MVLRSPDQRMRFQVAYRCHKCRRRNSAACEFGCIYILFCILVRCFLDSNALLPVAGGGGGDPSSDHACARRGAGKKHAYERVCHELDARRFRVTFVFVFLLKKRVGLALSLSLHLRALSRVLLLFSGKSRNEGSCYFPQQRSTRFFLCFFLRTA